MKIKKLKSFCTWFGGVSTLFGFVLYMVWVISLHGLGCFCTWFGLFLYMVWVVSVHGLGYFCTWFGLFLYMVLFILSIV